MSCDYVLLIVQRLSDEEDAVLEDDGGVSEDEIYGSGDGAVSVELTLRVGVEGILVTVHAAVVEDGSISSDSERNRLVLLRACGVLESQVLGDESVPDHRCKKKNC